MEKDYDGRHYVWGPVTYISECNCSADVSVDDDGYVDVDVSGDECWFGHSITINGIEVTHVVYEGFIFPDPDKNYTDLFPDSSAAWWHDDLRELIGDKTYDDLTDDDTTEQDEQHQALQVEAFVSYVEEHNLYVYKDYMRDFTNEWTIWLVADPDDADSQWRRMSAELAAHLYFVEAERYEDNYTQLRMYQQEAAEDGDGQ